MLPLATAALACASSPNAPPPLKREVLNYRLEVGDQLEIQVFNRSELSQQVPIRPDGMISIAPIGDVRAEGLTVEELDDVLSEALAPFTPDPQVTVFVRMFANQNIYVGGEVATPGLVRIHERTTSIMAIISAGGLFDTAERSEVLVLRDSGKGRPEVTTINLEDVLAGVAPDMVLQPYDVVFVAKSTVAKMNLFVEQYIRRVIPFRLVASGTYSYVGGDNPAGAAANPPIVVP
jgi:protein involved in polysaccharide export with SLBB domain